jgi:hypothetical protein
MMKNLEKKKKNNSGILKVKVLLNNIKLVLFVVSNIG